MTLLSIIALAESALGRKVAVPENCRQLVVVTTPSWESSRGILRRLERIDSGSQWQQVGRSCDVLVGRRGMAWGLGLHEAPLNAAPRKKEGDGCAPAGAFRITSAFGDKSASALTMKLPFRILETGTEAVDDSASRFYNQIVQRQSAQPDWKSSEQMSEIPDYRLGLVVAHNPQNRPSAGSCIFLHLWLGKRRGTAGCTVLKPANLRTLATWLDPERHPVLLQLPRIEAPAWAL